jgi:tetratricopeptide (TPR) repeat protein
MTSQEHGSQSQGRQRREPSLGRFDELRFAKPEERAPRTSLMQRVLSWDWRWILAALLLVFVLLLVLRQPLANWLWPQTRAERLHERAARALAQGKLTAPDGTGARELYSAALALDPDRTDARAGLDRVGQAALAQARAAISRRQFPQAHEALQLAEDLSVPRAQVDALREQLRGNEAASVGIDELLKTAAAARGNGKLEGTDGALPLYQRVLELEPDNTQALEGREDTLSDLLQQARSRLDTGDLAGASVVVRRVQQADAGHVELPDTLAALARAAENKRKQADRELRRGQLATALENYGAALLVNPEDSEALNGVQAVANAHARRSERYAADYRFKEAEAELQQARTIAGTSAAQNPAIALAQEHLARARQSQRQSSIAKPASASQRARVTQLLADASRAQARGDLLTPPGDSAFDKLRAARAIAPHDPRVLTASARLLPAAAECFSDALRANRLVRAGGCLDARRALEGDTATVRESSRELARRWLALGDQRLGAGELQGARAALDAARTLDPATEGLDAFAERLRTALLAPAEQGRQ